MKKYLIKTEYYGIILRQGKSLNAALVNYPLPNGHGRWSLYKTY